MNRKLAASLVLFALSLAALPALADPRAPLPSTPKTATPQPVTPKATARSKVALDDGGFYATARAGYGGFFTKAGRGHGKLFNLTLGYRLAGTTLAFAYDGQAFQDSSGVLHNHTVAVERTFASGVRLRAGMGVALLNTKAGDRLATEGSLAVNTGIGWDLRLFRKLHVSIDVPFAISVVGTGAFFTGLQLGLSFGATR